MPPPEPQQLAIAKARIAEMEAGVAQAEQRAAAIQANIDLMVLELENQRDIASRLRQSIFAERALIAPLRRLPPEILGEIITYCAMDPAGPRTILATLSLVCRAWRQTTLATPSAWCNIQVDCTTINRPHTRPPEDRLRDARMMFSRARSCPKDVTISGWVGTRNLELPNAVFDLVSGHAATLRSLEFRIPWQTSLTDGLKLKECLSAHMPILRGLFLHAFDMDTSSLIDLAQMPRLIALGECDSTLHIPSTASHARLLHRIAAVHGVNQTPIQLLRELHEDGNLQHLRTLSLRRHGGDDQHLDRDLIRAESLVSLALNCWGGLCDFFDVLVAPNLQRLVVNHSGGNASFTKTQSSALLKSLSARGIPQLRELYLSGTPLSDSDLTRFLRQLHLLETLVIYRARSSDKVMEALASVDSKKGNSGDWICPRLSRFAIQSADSKSAKFTISRLAVTDFVEARMTALTKAVLSKPVAQLVGVRHDNGELKGFGVGIPRDEWLWQDDLPGRLVDDRRQRLVVDQECRPVTDLYDIPLIGIGSLRQMSINCSTSHLEKCGISHWWDE
ncbi:hypothetical protein EXIGLDRAFT_374003 [Exidia glandulosa HHB12029]|uniref:Uncharacterized protein n=1 Tax=Exidia glandulosa HHB12029 TaxID=1314781 RepID=A0A165PYA2_EXIGL|nr:hypothetical protein EXIGLDRAFT_374003 [Exidia glandulosa HHB12029]